MQYEIYLDVFFLNNFVMDYLILLAVRKTLKCTATHGYVMLGALAGAFAACCIVCMPVNFVIKTLFMHLLVNSVMLLISLQPENVHDFLQAWFLLYILSFLMGGIMEWIQPYLGIYFREGVLWIAVTVISYFLFSGGVNFFEMLCKRRDCRCNVTLYLGKTVCTMRAVIDSGNNLSDSLTCKPVHIIDEKAMKSLTEQEKIQNFRYIPYCTIQKEESVLPVFTIDKMCVHGKTDRMIEYPLLGVSPQYRFSNGSYDVILHPEDC